MDEQNVLAAVRASLADTAAVKEIKMFGGIGFMLNGNLLVAASSRGLLARVGKEAESEALTRAGASPMVMRGRTMAGYIRVAAAALDRRSVTSWVQLARAFVTTLPKKKPTPKSNKGSDGRSAKKLRASTKT
jgi:TfoX/Sxy family transcriptional regulator of competence genes